MADKKYYSGIGWPNNIAANQIYYQEIAYALADKGFTLRSNSIKGASEGFITGVERFCRTRKKNIEDYLEVYLPSDSHNGKISDTNGFININHLAEINKAKELAAKYGEEGCKINKREFQLLSTAPFVALGKNLTTPSHFIITDVILYSINNKGLMEDGQGYSGLVARIINKISPQTHVFNFGHAEHRKRINGLLHNAK